MPLKPEDILENLAQTTLSVKSPLKNQIYSRTELLNAALYGIDELHKECVDLLGKHSPFKNIKSCL